MLMKESFRYSLELMLSTRLIPEIHLLPRRVEIDLWYIPLVENTHTSTYIDAKGRPGCKAPGPSTFIRISAYSSPKSLWCCTCPDRRSIQHSLHQSAGFLNDSQKLKCEAPSLVWPVTTINRETHRLVRQQHGEGSTTRVGSKAAWTMCFVLG